MTRFVSKKTIVMKKNILIAAVLSRMVSAQEPYDLNPYGKGVIDEKSASEIANEWHFPIKLTLIVRDEESSLVADALVNIGIDSRLHMDGYNNFKGKTDKAGRFTVEARGGGSSDVLVTKDGYYPSSPDVEWNDKRNLDIEELKRNGFQPWDQTEEVVLKKVGKSIPMIVRMGLASTDHIRYAPKLGEEVGYDLIAGDWIAPHGKGEIGDIKVLFESDFQGPEEYTTKAVFSFSNPDDGLIPIFSLSGGESLLKYPRSAPMDGYETKSIKLEKQSGKSPQPSQKEPIGYFFRIRTIKERGAGKIISAKYGKIVSESEQGAGQNPLRLISGMWKDGRIDPTPGFQVSYYLNPVPNDRNLEYDQRNNLAPDVDKSASYPP